MLKRLSLAGLLVVIVGSAFLFVNQKEEIDEEILVYSARKEHLIKPLFDAYTEKTGTQIRYITDKAAALAARLETEGDNTPADLFITVDAGNLWQAAEKDLLKSVESDEIAANVPAHLRDADNRWTGLSVRARTLVYHTDRVNPEDLSTYENLASSDWKGRLCLRTSKKVYNQSLVATMMARLGESKTEDIVKGWVDNLATDVFSNDTKTMQAILAGQCDVAIVNTYYFGRLQKKDPNIPLALFWPNQDDRGVHVNVSGAGVVRHAKNPQGAQKLLEWLTSEEAQGQFAALNLEFPVNAKVAKDPMVDAWGEFKGDTLNVAEAGRLQTDAIKLMDRVGYK